MGTGMAISHQLISILLVKVWKVIALVRTAGRSPLRNQDTGL